MTPERGQRIYMVFEAALKSDPDGRAGLLEELCAGDPVLRSEVERLLALDAEAERDGFLAGPASMAQDEQRPDESIDGDSEFDRITSLDGMRSEAAIPETAL